MKYSKPAIDIDQQIAKLRSRGLIIDDGPVARDFLRNISYYRLAGYWWPMQADKLNHLF
jgi:abortive infection bacteriophage resistance protein